MSINQLLSRIEIGDRIVRLLQSSAVGVENAIPRHIVMGHVCYDGPERPFRRIYVERGVASCDKGLYWARVCDIKTFRKYLMDTYGEQISDNRMDAFFKARKDLRRTVPPIGKQGDLSFDGAGV